MKKRLALLALVAQACAPGPAVEDGDDSRWAERARNVTIIRDDWGIPHIRGRTDADAVFGMIYAQAEDDFNRIEVNFLNSQGRLAEAEGESEIFRDLRMRLFIDPEEMRAQYAASPDWLKALMDAWADGLNYFLRTHPEVTPRVLSRFEPWMALTFSEGSIGGDIERVDLQALEAFYGGGPIPPRAQSEAQTPASGNPSSGARFASGIRPVGSLAESVGSVGEPLGSNGFAIAPANTTNGNALFLINPHTSFYFRAELQMASEEGLNAYGAVTWGQFFVYQGFNESAGWMHTSSGVDNIDEYLEDVVERDGALVYRHGDLERPVETREVTIRYRTSSGIESRDFTVYRTHHGPVVREAEGRWVTVALMEEPMNALIQSYSRTKARNHGEFVETMRRHTNSSNNTVFADAEGNIAYFHSNFIPVRDPSYDWDRPVDGSDPATDWQGVHTLEETPGVLNPETGWVQNTNNWPYSVSGVASPREADFPAYMQRGRENPRGVHAIRVLENRTDFTLESLVEAAYDPDLTAFELLLPSLFAAFEGLPSDDARRVELAEQLQVLRDWDVRWDVGSVATSLAVLWGEELMQGARARAREEGTDVYAYMVDRTTDDERLDALAAVSARLTEDFGTWRTPWGELNRFQRLTGDIDHPFDDDQPSLPVGFTSGRWGSLASFGARRHDGSRKLYGTSGNSFVAVVEFGERVRALAVTAGGQSGDPASPHFADQAERYTTGDLRPVYFYRDELEGHIEREYRPGDVTR